MDHSEILVRASGSINCVGKPLDYHGELVLPTAIGQSISMKLRKDKSLSRVSVAALNTG